MKVQHYEVSLRFYPKDLIDLALGLGLALDEDQAEVMLRKVGPQLYEVARINLEHFIEARILTENTLGKDTKSTSDNDGHSAAAGGHVSEEADLPRPAEE